MTPDSPIPAAPPLRTALRTHGFTESVIREMTRLCALHDGVNLAQGFPDFPAPREIKDAAIAAIEADHNQYAITWGAKKFRDALVAKTKRFYGLEYDPEREVTVTCGATEAIRRLPVCSQAMPTPSASSRMARPRSAIGSRRATSLLVGAMVSSPRLASRRF